MQAPSLEGGYGEIHHLLKVSLIALGFLFFSKKEYTSHRFFTKENLRPWYRGTHL